MIESLIRIISVLESLYLCFDKHLIRRANNIAYIPTFRNRRGGKRSYVEWGHVIGIFQTLLYHHLAKTEGNHILDIGSGAGLLGIASMPYITKGSYIGIDVMIRDVTFSRQHYNIPNMEFQHLNTQNAMYAPDQSSQQVSWMVDDSHFDMVTALSVWTHLHPHDAAFYFQEIDRVLKPDGKAIVTFFLLDEDYQKSLTIRGDGSGRYHRTPQKKWIFDQPHPESPYWLHPQWVNVPEDAIGVTPDGLHELLEETSLELVSVYSGNWKEQPGLYFQDILVFQKKANDAQL